MTKIFALLAVLLILSGALLVAVPRHAAPPASDARSAAPVSSTETGWPEVLVRARDVAEELNAPLSILFGLMSLYYSRRSYYESKARAAGSGSRA